MHIEATPASPASKSHDRQNHQKYLIARRIKDVGVSVVARQIVSSDQRGHGPEKIDVCPANEQRREIVKPQQARSVGVFPAWLERQRGEHRNEFDEEQELPDGERGNGSI